MDEPRLLELARVLRACALAALLLGAPSGVGTALWLALGPYRIVPAVVRSRPWLLVGAAALVVAWLVLWSLILRHATPPRAG